MTRDEMIDVVRQRAGMEDRDDADRALRATLATLSERIVSDEARDLASQLPADLQGELRTDGEAERFDADEFLRRVGDRAGIDDRHRLDAVRAAFAATASAVSEGELHDVVSQLPNDYEPLLVDAGGLRGRG